MGSTHWEPSFAVWSSLLLCSSFSLILLNLPSSVSINSFSRSKSLKSDRFNKIKSTFISTILIRRGELAAIRELKFAFHKVWSPKEVRNFLPEFQFKRIAAFIFLGKATSVGCLNPTPQENKMWILERHFCVADEVASEVEQCSLSFELHWTFEVWSAVRSSLSSNLHLQSNWNRHEFGLLRTLGLEPYCTQVNRQNLHNGLIFVI